MATDVNTPLRINDYPIWATIRGHNAVFDPEVGWFRWCDTGELMGDPGWTTEYWPDGGLTRDNGEGQYVIHFPDPVPPARGCAECGLLPTPEGHDACIANLPGILSACCGHGDRDREYRFTAEDIEENGRRIAARLKLESDSILS